MRVCDNCHDAVPVTEVEVVVPRSIPGLNEPVGPGLRSEVLFEQEYCAECLNALGVKDWSLLALRQPAPKSQPKVTTRRPRKPKSTPTFTGQAAATSAQGPTLEEVNAARALVGAPPLPGEDDPALVLDLDHGVDEPSTDVLNIDDPDILEGIDLS